jgi:hypothetical protein
MVEVEGRKDSLEKELATKDSYIRELEDIIVEKVGSSRQCWNLEQSTRARNRYGIGLSYRAGICSRVKG